MRYQLIEQSTYRGYELLENHTPYVQPILEKMIGMVEHMNRQYSDTYLVRFDLRFPNDPVIHTGNAESARRVSQLFTNYKKRLDNESQRFSDGRKLAAIQYLWVIEESTDKGIHAHCMIIYPKRQVDSFTPFYGQGALLSQLWAELNPETKNGEYLFEVAGKNYIQNKSGCHHIKRSDPSTLIEPIKHISYMAKLRTKAIDSKGYPINVGYRRWSGSQRVNTPVTDE